jgi:hypothetical protein
MIPYLFSRRYKSKTIYHSDDFTKTFESTHASQFKICQNILYLIWKKSIERRDTIAWAEVFSLMKIVALNIAKL